MGFQAIIFDLDGTLLDTVKDLANSMNFALRALGYPAHAVEAYRYFAGDGVEMMARRALPEDVVERDVVGQCVALMREHYSRHWSDYTIPYVGIPELLAYLERRRVPKAVLSNKPHPFTCAIVKRFFPDCSFEVVRGALPFVPKKPDPAAAIEIAAELALPPQRVLYLGDTNTDMLTAGRAGMYGVGALWGFRTAEELEANGARLLVKEPRQVIDIFENKKSASGG